MSLVRISTAHRYAAVTPPANPDPPPDTPPPDIDPETDYWATSRSVYDVPFESSLVAPDSIWTRPIGTGATRVNAGLDYANASSAGGWPGPNGRVTTDDEHLFLNPSDPARTLSVTEAGPGNGQQVRVPSTGAHDGKLNGCAAAVRVDNAFTVWQGQPLVLNAGGNPAWKYTIPTGHPSPIDLRAGDETTHWGSHGGSRLSTVGGSIRLGALNSAAEMIYHPLKINVYGLKYMSRVNNGYRWPALTADGNYNNSTSNGYYDGSVPECRMGSLLALPADYDFAANGITEVRALKLGKTLKFYGAYIVDNTAWDVYGLSLDIRAKDVAGQWTRSASSTPDVNFHNQLHTMITQLQVIDNNAPGQTCAGGGDPLAAGLFAPPVSQ